ncbi:MAG TPA: hypothetical protein VFN57_02380 [Thermomicrobiaceae bacterium]|nr:hypothetical protein [Thermomicrobiaceae bacterium]
MSDAGDRARAARDLAARVRNSSGWETLRDVFYGMFFYDSVRTLQRQRADLEHLFILVMFGDLVGVPILPPYYSLRLLPFTVPHVQQWKNRLLRERDLTDLIG